MQLNHCEGAYKLITKIPNKAIHISPYSKLYVIRSTLTTHSFYVTVVERKVISKVMPDSLDDDTEKFLPTKCVV